MISAETSIAKLRSKMFDYPENKQEQAQRVLRYLKVRLFRSKAHRDHVELMLHKRGQRYLVWYN